MSKSIKEHLRSVRPGVLIGLISYAIFFSQVFIPGKYLAGSDPIHYFYPSRFYLWESLKSGYFPFWNEKLYSGFPIYADSERVYLNIINVILVYLTGPLTSYKILHFAHYMLGSVFFYSFLKRFKYSLAGAAVTIISFYNTFFLLFHQQHFNMVLTLYLIPVALWLVAKLLETKKIRYLIGFSVLTAYTIYFGSFQSVMLFIFAPIVYFIVFGLRNWRLKHLLISVFLYFFLTIALSLPQLIPSFELYKYSFRDISGPSFLEGSYNPIMLINLAYPYTLGVGTDYKWNTVDNGYYIHETYVYTGITVLILALLGLTMLKGRRFKLFIWLNIFAFLFLGFWAYLPIFNRIPIPGVSMFRYWARSVILFDLAISITAGYFISNIWEYKFTFNRRLFLKVSIPVTLYLIYAYAAFSQVRYTVKVLRHLPFVYSDEFKVWLIILMMFIAIMYLLLKFKNVYLTFALVMLVIVDLAIFGENIVMGYMRNTREIYPTHHYVYPNQRIAVLSSDFFWNKALYQNSWGIFGYSQYQPGKYTELSGTIDTLDLRKISGPEKADKLYQLGVSKVLNEDGTILFSFDENKDLLAPFDGRVDLYFLKEGRIYWLIHSEKDQPLNTYIQYYPGWQATLDGKRAVVKEASQSPFITLDVHKGPNIISLKFVPETLYRALAVSAVLLIVSVVLIKMYIIRYNDYRL